MLEASLIKKGVDLSGTNQFEPEEVEVATEVANPEKQGEAMVELTENTNVYISRSLKRDLISLHADQPITLMNKLLTHVIGETNLFLGTARGLRGSEPLPSDKLGAIKTFMRRHIRKHGEGEDGFDMSKFTTYVNRLRHNRKRKISTDEPGPVVDENKPKRGRPRGSKNRPKKQDVLSDAVKEKEVNVPVPKDLENNISNAQDSQEQAPLMEVNSNSYMNSSGSGGNSSNPSNMAEQAVFPVTTQNFMTYLTRSPEFSTASANVMGNMQQRKEVPDTSTNSTSGPLSSLQRQTTPTATVTSEQAYAVPHQYNRNAMPRPVACYPTNGDINSPSGNSSVSGGMCDGNFVEQRPLHDRSPSYPGQNPYDGPLSIPGITTNAFATT